jgi:ferritin
MFSKAVHDKMNDQIQAEMYSAYLYLSMAAQFETQNLPGFAHWMRKQSAEELEHALKFFDFINERGGAVMLKGIEQPPTSFGSATDVFKASLAHEQLVTSLINGIYDVAVQEKDYASQIFLNWFVSEQVEEEKHATEILETLKMAGDKGNSLIMLDHALGKR